MSSRKASNELTGAPLGTSAKRLTGLAGPLRSPRRCGGARLCTRVQACKAQGRCRSKRGGCTHPLQRTKTGCSTARDDSWQRRNPPSWVVGSGQPSRRRRDREVLSVCASLGRTEGKPSPDEEFRSSKPTARAAAGAWAPQEGGMGLIRVGAVPKTGAPRKKAVFTVEA